MSATVSRTGLAMSRIGLSCKAFMRGHRLIDRAASVRLIRQALDIGISMLDMADFYAGGQIERLVGEAVGKRRGEALIATRGRPRPGGAGGAGGAIRPGASPDHLRRSCEMSLRRLKADYIDLYYLEDTGPDVPTEESVGELAELVTAGKIRHIGLATASPQQLRRCHAVHPVAAIRVEYSLLDRRIESECLPAAGSLGVALVACRPLGSGILAGRITPPEQQDANRGCDGGPRCTPEELRDLRSSLRAAEELAAGLDLGLSRLALGWLLSQPGVVPIPGTSNPLHLEMNASAAHLRLPASERERLAGIFPRQARTGEAAARRQRPRRPR